MASVEARLVTGRPWGGERFIRRLKKRVKRGLRKGRLGPPEGRPNMRNS